jgi:NTP pyrophosphatase (non-canonical NTP hydrolase)
MIKQTQRDELLGFLLDPQRHERNILKLCEEMSELQEVLLKYVNKKAEGKPSITKIVEELGDVLFRSAILSKQFDIEEVVLERAMDKEQQVYEYFTAKQTEKV